jgi:hypothetical protein
MHVTQEIKVVTDAWVVCDAGLDPRTTALPVLLAMDGQGRAQRVWSTARRSSVVSGWPPRLSSEDVSDFREAG